MLLKYSRKIINYLERKEFQKLLKTLPIDLGSEVVFKKNPMIQINLKAKLIIGNNVMINSDNY